MVLPALVFAALAAFAAALLWSPHTGRAAGLHLMFAVGAMPLIFGAMTHFIPVLTRSRQPAAWLAVVPVLGLAGGALVVGALSTPDLLWGQHAGAVLALVAAATLFVWSRRRRAGMLGRPHPCLAWYEMALACLGLALAAILASAAWPQQTFALRRLHLHLNTLGFIGLTALGTLAVLLPTVVGKPDAGTAARLQRDLPSAAGGTLLVAAGAAWFAPLALLGASLLAIAWARLGASWLTRYRAEVFAAHGAAPLLAAAWFGLGGALVIGTAAPHVGALVPTAAFVAGFLLPLVSGAATQLLPVWLQPGVQRAWHATLRARLARYGGIRAALFCVGGVAAGTGFDWGLYLAAAALLWFMLQAAAALTHAFTQQKESS